uniref:Uncharacterized protein n=1 Tax=Rhizophora mucronata TaxID=61149 RepID=A0A2P2NAX7_RHIMU
MSCNFWQSLLTSMGLGGMHFRTSCVKSMSTFLEGLRLSRLEICSYSSQIFCIKSSSWQAMSTL